jgi:hypothetical protein
MRARFVTLLGVVLIGGLLLPATAVAQGGSISGLVEDTTGGILPGVRVEAASPVLIEGALSAFTDGAGRYTITTLRPGTYTVTFTLDGFRTFVRDGIVLVGDAAVQVNAQMTVGALEETVTVSGQSPLVDVQQTRSQFVATREMMDTLPGARTFAARALYIPGVNNRGMADGQYWPAARGNTWRDAQTQNDGMRANVVIDDGQWQMGWSMNDAATSELTYQTGGGTAEVQTGGVVQNAIPKEGGNTFAGTFFGYLGHERLGGSNADDELRAILGNVNRPNYNYDLNPGFGGPIKKDRLWFFVSARRTDSKTWTAAQYFTGEGSPEDRAFNGFPDADYALCNVNQPLAVRAANCPQSFARGWNNNGLARLTTQVTNKNKVRMGFERVGTKSQIGEVTSRLAPENSNRIPIPVGYHAQARWTSTLTSRLLLEAGFATQRSKWMRQQYEWNRGAKSSYLNLSNSWQTGAWWITGQQPEVSYNAKASMSYVTGSHNLKVGFENRWANLGLDQQLIAGDIRQYYFIDAGSATYRACQPGQVPTVTCSFPVGAYVLATPLGNFGAQVDHDLGIYAQDVWTIGRWTLNLGLRADIFRSSVPPQQAPAGNWVPARSFPEYTGGDFKDLVPRIGVAYDLFGDGKTALKFNASQYVNQDSTTLAMLVNPMASFTWSARQEFRTWNDLDRNGSAQNADGTVQFNEIGPSPNVNFATERDAARIALDGRPGQWELSGSVQHELRPGLSLGFGYYRRNYYNMYYEDNAAISINDWTPFTVTAPNDPRLEENAGRQVTLYTLNPAAYGRSDRVLRTGPNTDRTYNGVEFTVNGRFGRGGFYSGSVNYELTNDFSCDNPNPNSLQWCDYEKRLRGIDSWDTQFKAYGSYPLPWGIQASGFLQGYSGPSKTASWTVTSAIAGRSILTPTGGASVSAALVPTSGWDRLPFQTKTDIRVMRRFRMGTMRISPVVDVFNLFNQNTTLTALSTCGATVANRNDCGATLHRISTILPARLARLGMEVDW